MDAHKVANDANVSFKSQGLFVEEKNKEPQRCNSVVFILSGQIVIENKGVIQANKLVSVLLEDVTPSDLIENINDSNIYIYKNIDFKISIDLLAFDIIYIMPKANIIVSSGLNNKLNVLNVESINSIKDLSSLQVQRRKNRLLNDKNKILYYFKPLSSLA